MLMFKSWIYYKRIKKKAEFICELTKKQVIIMQDHLYRRLLQYFNAEYLLKHENFAICRALLKYGFAKFSLKILEYCGSKDLIIREQYYIDLLNPEYNILKKAGSYLGYIHTEATRAKIALALKGEKHPLFGKSHNVETLVQMSRVKLSLAISLIERDTEKTLGRNYKKII